MADAARHMVSKIARTQHHVITRAQAGEVGFDRRRVATGIRSGWLDEPVRGVLTLAEARATWHQSVMILVLAAGGHAVASHRTAARLHEFDGFEKPTNATVELSVSRAFRLDTTLPCVVHHVTPLDPNDVTVVDGISCTTIDRTLSDLGSVVPDPQLVRRAPTSARRRGLDVQRLQATAERLHRPGQRGTGVLLRLLRAIPWEGTLPATWFEELLQLCLDDPRLPQVVPQFAIRDSTGAVVARTDLGIPSVKLGLEAHSREFHWGPLAEQLDEQRDIAVALCGWELTYLGWFATKRPSEVLNTVRSLVETRRRELRQPDL